MVFWIVAAALALAVGALLVLAMLRTRRTEANAAAKDVAVYRDQLSEVDRDLARGVIAEDEAARTRVEVSRRLLEADKAAAAARFATAPRRTTQIAAGVLGLVVVAGTLGIYRELGAPGYPDLPLQTRIADADAARAERPGQAEAEATLPEDRRVQLPAADPQYAELMERLRAMTAERPDDVQGHLLLAQNEARLGNFPAAHAAMARVVELKGEAATAGEYADLADLRILAAGGYVSPEAEDALRNALARDARNGTARYYSGLLFKQTGRPDLAFRLWRQLLVEGPDEAPWIRPIRMQIEDVAADAGVRFDLEPPPAMAMAPERGPSAADIEAAAEMTPEQRMEMIRGMVAGLSDRLANEGGPPEDWARLIGALGVLGETERAQAIWTEGQTVFADMPEALTALRAAAERAGLSP